MKYLTMLALCFFVISISVFTFAADPAQIKPAEQKIETEAAEEGKILEVKKLPSTLITDAEKKSGLTEEVEGVEWQYDYADDSE